MKKFFNFLFLPLYFSGLFLCQDSFAGNGSPQKAQVMLIGVFHFSNPGKDVAKTDAFDILSTESQAYLEKLSENIQGFKPTKVLVEYTPENQTRIQKQYRDYLNGKLKLKVDETHQIGFRVAKRAGLSTLYGYDEHKVGWNSDALFEYMQTDGKALGNKYRKTIKQVEEHMNSMFKNLSLREVLIKFNGKALDDMNKALYIETNAAYANNEYIGANAAASWWHRNFIMYAKIQAHATPGERVLVIGGQGHTAILKDFLAVDPDRIAVDIKKYL